MPGRNEKPPKAEDTRIEPQQTIKMSKVSEDLVGKTVVDMPKIVIDEPNTNVEETLKMTRLEGRNMIKKEKDEKRKQVETMIVSAGQYDKIFWGNGSDHYFAPTGTGHFNLVFDDNKSTSFQGDYSLENVLESIERENFVWRIEHGTPKKRERKKAQEMQKVRDPKIEKILEKFNALPEMGIIRIGNREYRKINDEYFFAGEVSMNAKTAAVETVKSEDIRKEIEKAGASKISFPGSSELRLIEDTSNDEKRRASFMKRLAQYYPQLQKEIRSGVFTKIANYLTNNETKIPPTEDDVKKYIQEKSLISQGSVGDCYLMAALNSFKRQRPDLYLEFVSRNIMRNDEEKMYYVRFPGLKISNDLSQKGWIEIADAEITSWKKEKRIDADIPDLVLERAYASAISRTNKGKGQTMILDAKGKMEFEGGFGHRVLHHLLSSDMAKKFEIGDYNKDGHKKLIASPEKSALTKIFLKDYAAQPMRYIVVAATPHRSEDNQEQNDTKKFTVDGVRLHYRHQYSIVGYKDGKVEIENPHNTSKRIFMPEETFLKAFTQVSFAEVVGEYAAMHKKDEA